jgi:outer membrane protein TolC
MIGTMADPATPAATAAESSLAANAGTNPNPGRVEITFDDHAVKAQATDESTLLMETDPKTLAAQPPSALPAFPSHYPIDLTSALRLAEVENPVIAGARTQISAALAERKAAYALLLPTLRAGGNYHGHVGNYQRSSGRILAVSSQSLYYGGGAGAIGSGTIPPDTAAVQIASPLADAFFEPLAAQRRLVAAKANAAATSNNVLLEVATLYLDLEAAELRLEVTRTTAEQAAEVAKLTVSYSKVGRQPPSDGDRSLSELRLFQAAVQRAEQEVSVASTRLVHRLHLNPTVRVHTEGLAPSVLTLIDPALTPAQLLEIALRTRPELVSATAEVDRAEVRLGQELARPLLPTISVTFSGGNFGGGSNLVPPTMGQYGGRTNFDVLAYWTLRGLGVGNLGIQKQRRAQIGEAVGARSVVTNQVRREVVAAHAQSAANLRRLESTRKSLESAELGYTADLKRAQGAVGRPIEVLDSLRLLNHAKLEVIGALIGYDQAQFRLFVALGSPPPLGQGADRPLPPAPIAHPPLPPPNRLAAHSPGDATPPIPAGTTELR